MPWRARRARASRCTKDPRPDCMTSSLEGPPQPFQVVLFQNNVAPYCFQFCRFAGLPYRLLWLVLCLSRFVLIALLWSTIALFENGGQFRALAGNVFSHVKQPALPKLHQGSVPKHFL